MLKKIIQLKLKILAKIILAKYRPKVVGITGSVGKTSAKEAVYSVLSKKFNVRRNIKNYNNEIGVPLTIIGAETQGRSIAGWIIVFLKALKLILWRDNNYPEILILEMGVDRPGDMAYLTKIVKPDIGIITLIGPVHLEFFGTIENIQKEKGKLIENIKKDGWAIVNYDNEKSRKMLEIAKSRVLAYGFDEKADIRAQEARIANLETANLNEYSTNAANSTNIGNIGGVNFKLGYNGSFVPLLLPQVVGYNAVYAALAGASVGISLGMNLVEIANALKDYKSPRGRMNLIKGIKNTLIIDDSYNSSPQSSMSALKIAGEIKIPEGAEKFAVLGDMLELGSHSEKGHREVGKYLADVGMNKLITVGERARDIARGAEEAGMAKDNIFHFDTSEEVGLFIQDRIEKGDLILVKGSQGVRMEKVVKEIMADPMHAKELLVRQDEEWLRK